MLALLAATLGAASVSLSPRTEIVETNGLYRLLRDGKPYEVKGAGCSDTSDAALARLKAAGGNSIRTWGIGDDTQALLDRAHKHGITVTLGYWLGHTAHGFDWTDQKRLDDQFAKVQEAVRKYRNHPAVLMWALGNEMEMGGNDTPTLWKEVERLAKMVKKEDPTRPVATVVAEMNREKVQRLDTYAPSIDLVGINSYGGLRTLGTRLKEFGWKRPWMVTEFGPMGQWEVPKTPWGAAIEPTSTAKAKLYAENYANVIKGNPGWCLGSYVFIWGNKQEETATWFGMMLPSGENLGAVDEMTKGWTGKYPANRAPILEAVTLSIGQEVGAKTRFRATAKATDPEGDNLQIFWQVKEESTDKKTGGYAEAAPPSVDTAVKVNGRLEAVVESPDKPGPYRLFIYIRDGKGNAAVGNVPFMVK